MSIRPPCYMCKSRCVGCRLTCEMWEAYAKRKADEYDKRATARKDYADIRAVRTRGRQHVK